MPPHTHRRAHTHRPALLALWLLAASSSAALVRPNVDVIAHRGDSYHRPEHTIEAYREARLNGATHIEFDLSDLFIIHSPILDDVFIRNPEITCNVTRFVHPERRAAASCFCHATRTFAPKEGAEPLQLSGMFIDECVYNELKTLRLKQRFPDTRSTAYDGYFSPLSFAEGLRYVQTLLSEEMQPNRSLARPFSLYVELKNPSLFYAQLREWGNGDDNVLERLVFTQLIESGVLRMIQRTGGKLYFECFELTSIRKLRALFKTNGFDNSLDKQRVDTGEDGGNETTSTDDNMLEFVLLIGHYDDFAKDSLVLYQDMLYDLEFLKSLPNEEGVEYVALSKEWLSSLDNSNSGGGGGDSYFPPNAVRPSPSELMNRLKGTAGLHVVTWTHRPEARFILNEFKDDNDDGDDDSAYDGSAFEAELRQFLLVYGVDGVFIDDPAFLLERFGGGGDESGGGSGDKQAESAGSSDSVATAVIFCIFVAVVAASALLACHYMRRSRGQRGLKSAPAGNTFEMV